MLTGRRYRSAYDGKLARGDVAPGILALAEEVDPELGKLRAVNLDDLHLQLHLAAVRLSYDERIDHALRIEDRRV